MAQATLRGVEATEAALLPGHRRLLICAPAYPSAELARGGVQVAVRAQVERLARRHQVTVVAPYRLYLPLPRYAEKRREIPPSPSVESEGPVRIFRPRHLHLPGLWRIVDPAAAVTGILRGAARAGRPDLIHAHWLHPHGFAAVNAGRLLGIPVVVTAHGSDVARLDGREHTRYYRSTARLTLARASALICVSVAIANRLAELGAEPDRLHVIPNGVDVERFRPRERSACRAELGQALAGVEAGAHLLVYAGNLVPVKQVDRLLRAVAALGKREGLPPAVLAVAGEGPEERRLRDLARELGISERTLFVGRRPHHEIPLWLAAADLVVLPSRSEGMPLVVPEALASGTPLVASRVGGIPECVEDEVTGILVDPEGVPSLAIALSAALQRNWDRDLIAAAARPFGWDAVVDRIDGAYRRI